MNLLIPLLTMVIALASFLGFLIHQDIEQQKQAMSHPNICGPESTPTRTVRGELPVVLVLCDDQSVKWFQ